MIFKKRGIIMTAVPLLLAGCFFLPVLAARIADAGTLDSLIFVDSQSISFETTPDLGLSERLALASNLQTESLSLENGKTMDAVSAYAKAVSELRKFFGGSSFDFDFDNCNSENPTAVFLINSKDPSINLIAWNIILDDSQGHTITAEIDDETGVILQLFYKNASVNFYIEIQKESIEQTKGDSSVSKMRDKAAELSEMMADYYGLDITLADYEFIGGVGYYKAELFSENMVLPMFGVVRETGFTVNERV